MLGNLALMAGDQDRALEHFDEAIHGQRQGGNAWGLAIVLSVAAGLRMSREEFAQAQTQAEEVLMLGEELEDPRTIAYGLDLFGSLLAARGHTLDAVRLWGASDGLLERVGGSLVPTIGWIRQRYLEGAREAVGADAFDAAHAAGRECSPTRRCGSRASKRPSSATRKDSGTSGRVDRPTRQTRRTNTL